MAKNTKKMTPFDMHLQLILRSTKFSHRTKSLRTYASSKDFSLRQRDFIHRVEFVGLIPLTNIVPFVLALDNQFRNAGSSNTLQSYFRNTNHPMNELREVVPYKHMTELNYMDDENILAAYNRVKMETLDGWREAIGKINNGLHLAAYRPKHRKRKDRVKEAMKNLFNPKIPAKAIKVSSASPIEWRKKLRTNGGEDNGT